MLPPGASGVAGVHVATPMLPDTAQIVCGDPPAAPTRLILPDATNPIERLSGDQNISPVAPSVPERRRGLPSHERHHGAVWRHLGQWRQAPT